MGWKGTVRSIRAAHRAGVREAERKDRERARRRKQQNREAEVEWVRNVVADYDAAVHELRTLHHNCSREIDWQELADLAPPPPLDESDSIMDRIPKYGERRRRLAEVAWQEAFDEWDETVKLASRVLTRSPDALLDALEATEPMSEVSVLGSHIVFEMEPESDFLDCRVKVHGSQVIPSTILTQLKTGKLSEKKMPVGKFHELHQDYVCGAVLRVAAETFAALPVELLRVTATDYILNTATGHEDLVPIVSAIISRDGMDRLNLRRVDPSDAMSNFVHHMDFKVRRGFAPVSKVLLDESDNFEARKALGYRPLAEVQESEPVESVQVIQQRRPARKPQIRSSKRPFWKRGWFIALAAFFLIGYLLPDSEEPEPVSDSRAVASKVTALSQPGAIAGVEQARSISTEDSLTGFVIYYDELARLVDRRIRENWTTTNLLRVQDNMKEAQVGAFPILRDKFGPILREKGGLTRSAKTHGAAYKLLTLENAQFRSKSMVDSVHTSLSQILQRLRFQQVRYVSAQGSVERAVEAPSDGEIAFWQDGQSHQIVKKIQVDSEGKIIR